MSSGDGLEGRRVLVIEDEALLSMMLEDILESIGCEVVATAARFDDAMMKAEALDFDVALLDVNLNGTCSAPIGLRLAQRGIPFVLATGYGSRLPESVPAAPILQKPFDRNGLARAMLVALAGSDSGT